jgi:hypothetical protein
VAEIDILEMRKLVSALETSAQGSPVLDLELKCEFEQEGPAGNRTAGMGLEAELAPETIEIILGEMVTPYTRSLDSALPGEDIVFSMYSAAKNLWVSVHRDANGREFVSWAATEPLSRRAAALRGFASISTDGAKAEAVSLLKTEVGINLERGADSGSLEVSSRHLETDTGQPGWRVRF